MKSMKFAALSLSALLLFSSCGISNTAGGALIGGGAGGGIGALVGQLIGKGKGAAIGAAVGTAVGAGAGALIGHKMDKAKKAAEAAAKAEILYDKDGTPYVKATFEGGLLFASSSSALKDDAKAKINNFIAQLSAEDKTFDLAIAGFTDNDAWKGSTAEQSKAKNKQLSLSRAQSVQTQITAAGYPASRILQVVGLGEEQPVASNATAEGKAQNRRVEVFILPSKEMIEAANAQAK